MGARPPIKLPYLGGRTIALVAGTHPDVADILSRDIWDCAFVRRDCKFHGDVFTLY